MIRKFLCAVFLLTLIFSPAYAQDFMNVETLKVPLQDSMNMSGIPVAGTRNANSSEIPEYDLARMIRVNPDFTTYPETNGIIWRKYTSVSYSANGGTEITRLYIIFGRKGLENNWLKWNIATPENGSIKILRASINNAETGRKIKDVENIFNPEQNINEVNFNSDDMPEKFILILAWQEKLQGQLALEGLFWFQENLRVWESIVEIISSQTLSYVTFPQERLTPAIQDYGHEKIYTWRLINLEPLNNNSLARISRSGIAISQRRGESGIAAVIHDRERISDNVKIPAEGLKIYRENKNEAAKNFLDWLNNQPEIILAESNANRVIPENPPYTKFEKMLLARSWLKELKVNVVLNWNLPFEPDPVSPLCPGIFYAPVLEVKGVRNLKYYEIGHDKYLAGKKIFFTNEEGKLLSKRIPDSKSTNNRLSAQMDFRLDENGLLNGTVKIILRGGWIDLITGTPQAMVLALFPDLNNFTNAKFKAGDENKNPELEFEIVNKPGVAGTGQGILAIMPCFEPVILKALPNVPPTIELKFPFIIEQNFNLALPKSAGGALVSGSVMRGREKINYSEAYQNRRHKLTGEARLEVNMPIISLGNMNLLRHNLSQWHIFSARNIPVR